ncbi:MAG: hypothetical protein WC498_02890 [Candidatus Saccharimonadales bacterium]
MDDILTKIQADHPQLSFAEGSHFSWHAHRNHVSYKASKNGDHKGTWALLHEVGHALLAHAEYTNDVQLLQMEVVAWEKATELAKSYGLEIDEDYMQDCLDTYRDWLHLRSTCPTCHSRSAQETPSTYRCFNCQTTWKVTRSRLCRPYRLQEV